VTDKIKLTQYYRHKKTANERLFYGA